MKSVLISIQPKWCELIASGKKTVEVRKTKPKIETPFKVYIYCTQGDALALPCLNNPHYAIHRMNNGTLNGRQMTAEEREQSDHSFANGKVIGEFVCDIIHDFNKSFFDEQEPQDTEEIEFWLDQFNLSYSELCSYVGLKDFYGWHISDLVIYDKPKELGEFWSADKCPYANKDSCTYKGHCFRAGQTKRCGDTLTRPPQSWCYVEKGADNEQREAD